jgi:predicted RNA binding protein YcfA (HicA-like mRNA interferase family)
MPWRPSVRSSSDDALMAKKYRDVRRALRKAGWSVARVSGSHEIWEHPDGRTVVIPGGGKDNREVPTGTPASIRRDTGLRDLR